MSTKANSASFIKWRLDNAEKVLQYKRDYHRKNYERIYERIYPDEKWNSAIGMFEKLWHLNFVTSWSTNKKEVEDKSSLLYYSSKIVQ